MGIPKKQINGITFYPIPQIDDIKVLLGADKTSYFSRDNLPEVPKEFEEKAQELFFEGGKLTGLNKKVSINRATRMLKSLLGSFEPSHEAKITTVAYALWLWSSEEL